MTDAALTLPQAAVNRAIGATLAGAAIWIGVFLSGFVIREPAPYELFMVVLIGLWTLTGLLTIPRAVMLPFLLLMVFNIGGVISMTQMTEWKNAPLYIASSTFLALSGVFFACVIAARPARLALVFNAWMAAALLTSLAAIAGYFDLFPGAEVFTRYGRAKGVFEDPNVFAPYLVLPALFATHALLTRPARYLLPAAAGATILFFAIFLSFSRAGWGLLLMCGVLLVAALFLNSASGRFRLRILLLSLFAVAGAVVVLIVALQFEQIRTLFFERAQLLQDYDAARLGRFERHWIGLLKAAETPLGIGPLEFGRIFGEDTHNIWLKALFDYSWLGFAAYLALTVLTLAAGFRLLFRDRPWQPYLLCAYIAYVGHVAVGTVIDTDHWRHFYLLLGIIWGCIALEARHQYPRDDQGLATSNSR